MRIIDGSSDVCSADLLEPAHIGPQRFGQGDAAVLLLVVLQDRYEGAPDREARAVQGVDEACPLLAGLAEPRLHAPGLKLAAIGAARNLAIGALPRQPDLDVEGLLRGEAHEIGRANV